MASRIALSFVWLGLWLSLAACRPASLPVNPDTGQQTQQTAAATPTAPAVEALLAPSGVDTPQFPLLPTGAPAPDLISGPDPLRFIFPSPGPAPISAWRPPLYPTPWAPTPYDHFFFTRPIGADQVNWPLADYRYGGVFIKGVVHTGVDIPAPKGTQVMAASPGRVVWAGYGLYALQEDPKDPYGLAVAIKHDFGYQGDVLYTVYGHMDQIFVNRGQRVNGGDVIGLVGETGKVTGVHLHFEVRLSKNNWYGSLNPELWVAPPQGWGILAGRVMDDSGVLLEQLRVNVRAKDADQSWYVNTYASGGANSDPYYRENMVLGDLPARRYDVWVTYENTIYNQEVKIRPGMVSYFTFWGKKGFNVGLPPTPTAPFPFPTPTRTPRP